MIDWKIFEKNKKKKDFELLFDKIFYFFHKKIKMSRFQI